MCRIFALEWFVKVFHEVTQAIVVKNVAGFFHCRPVMWPPGDNVMATGRNRALLFFRIKNQSAERDDTHIKMHVERKVAWLRLIAKVGTAMKLFRLFYHENELATVARNIFSNRPVSREQGRARITVASNHEIANSVAGSFAGLDAVAQFKPHPLSATQQFPLCLF